MVFYLGGLLKNYFGPARLLQSYAVLIVLALYLGFILAQRLLPAFFSHLPCDRGRDFTPGKEAAKGKPTGAGVVFITIFVALCFLFVPMDGLQIATLILTWFMMLTGFLDDRSLNGWGEYRKALLDLVLTLGEAVLLAHYIPQNFAEGQLVIWIPFTSHAIAIAPWLYIIIATIMLWASVNTTNCTDGVDGLSSSLVLIALFTMAIIFYVILGHIDMSFYLLVPHLISGASWGVMTICLAGILMGYLWHNAFPSKVLMGDAGSRALGFYIGVCVLVSGNPFIFLATSSIIFINGSRIAESRIKAFLPYKYLYHHPLPPA